MHMLIPVLNHVDVTVVTITETTLCDIIHVRGGLLVLVVHQLFHVYVIMKMEVKKSVEKHGPTQTQKCGEFICQARHS